MPELTEITNDPPPKEETAARIEDDDDDDSDDTLPELEDTGSYLISFNFIYEIISKISNCSFFLMFM